MNVINISAKDLRHAANIKERIDTLQALLNQLLNQGSATETVSNGVSSSSSTRRGKSTGRKMSAAARARLSAIARARWRKAKAAGRMAL